MKTPLRVLIVEDTPDDAELTLRELRRGGYDPDFERVETAEEMHGALKQQDWEVILCDYTMPAFSAPKALALLTELDLDIPFIVVSGKIGEDTAVEMMRAGAHDYVMKGNLARLPSVVKRELAEAEIRRQREQAEEELRLGALRWQITFEGVADGICLLDSQAKVLQCNSAMGELAGKRPAELVGRKCCEMVHGSTEHVEDCPFQRACKSLQREELELAVADRWFRVTVDPLTDDNGEFSGAVHVVTDITERKRAEREIGNLAKFPSESPDPVLRIAKDGTIIFANKAAHPLLDAWSSQDQEGAVLPAEWSKLIRDVLVSGQREDVEIECDSRIFLTTFAPVVEAGYVNLYARDITDRREMEKERRVQSEIAVNLIEGVCLIRASDCVIVHANRRFEQMFGYEPGEMLGKHISIVNAPDDKTSEEVARRIKKCSDREGFWRGEIRNIRKDGTLFWGYGAVSTFDHPEHGRVYLSVHADVTDRKKAEEMLQKTMVDTVDTLASVVEQRDPYTAGHQRRVAQLACAIAEEMRFSQEQVHGVHLAGIVHDVGKISVPAEILTKPGRLTEIEFNMVKTHAQAGSDVLQRIEFPWPIAQMVLQHHERMDGSGYPQGLSGEGILLEARILAVADTVEAMASHRPYRAALGKDKALLEIAQAKGTLYDPDAVDACLKLFREKDFKFE